MDEMDEQEAAAEFIRMMKPLQGELDDVSNTFAMFQKRAASAADHCAEHAGKLPDLLAANQARGGPSRRYADGTPCPREDRRRCANAHGIHAPAFRGRQTRHARSRLPFVRRRRRGRPRRGWLPIAYFTAKTASRIAAQIAVLTKTGSHGQGLAVAA
jgi:hypothetical protein